MASSKIGFGPWVANASMQDLWWQPCNVRYLVRHPFKSYSTMILLLSTNLTLMLHISRLCVEEKAVWPQQSFPSPFLSFPLPPFSSPYPEDEDRQRFILNLSVCGKLCERCEWASKVWNSTQIAAANRPTELGALPERAVISRQEGSH